MALAGAHAELCVRDQRGLVLTVRERHDVVRVAVPEADRHADVSQQKTPVACEEHQVVHERPEPLARGGVEVVEEHRLHLGASEDAPVALGCREHVQEHRLLADRAQRTRRGGEPEPERITHQPEQNLEPRQDPDDSARSRLLAARRRNPAEHDPRDDPFRHRVRGTRARRARRRTARRLRTDRV